MKNRRPLGEFSQNAFPRIARTVRWAIALIGWVLVLLFGYLQFKNFADAIDLTAIKPDYVRQFVLFVYYTCWVGGATFDTNIQEQVYVVATGRARLPFNRVLLILAFGGVAAFLLWFANDDQGFTIVLDIFFLLNVIGFVYILFFVKPFIEESRSTYETRRDYANLLRLDIVAGYMNGGWQWRRFLMGAFILALLNLICFVDPIASIVSTLTIKYVPDPGGRVIVQMLPTVFLTLFVASMEGWIWVKRLIARVSLAVVEQLSEKYELRVRRRI